MPMPPDVSEAAQRSAQLVTDGRTLTDLIKTLRREPSVAVDIESNGFHRYPERVCLVQLASRNECYIVDPLAIDDMAPLGRLLEDESIQKVLHGPDYDLRSLDREWGFRIRNLYDTSVAAHLVGLERRGLAAASEHFLGVILKKEKRLQRADWSLRPLSQAALSYAANDVAYLLQLRDAIVARLASLGRTDWALEESARLEGLRYAAPEPPERAYLSMKGSRALDGRGLAVLKELVVLREREARRLGRPPFRVLSDRPLLFLAANPRADLAQTPGVGAPALRRMGNGIRKALKDGMASDPVK
ncbi:MAG: ribonuclease D, partial [Dehalococcoidia bacterium]